MLVPTAILVFTESFQILDLSKTDYLIRGHSVVQESLESEVAFDALNSKDATSVSRGNSAAEWDVTVYLRVLSESAIIAEKLTR